MKKIILNLWILGVIIAVSLPGCQSTSRADPTNTPRDATSQYLASLDLDHIMNAGSDYAAESNNPSDPFSVVQALIDKYKDVDRKRVLDAIFQRLTVHPKNETEKEIAVLYFVQRLSVHDFTSSFMGVPVFDPLALFDIHVMDCQKDSRMIADIYAAAGYESRLVDMYGHMVAEVRYDGSWHYADADMFGGGQIVTMPDGHIPSLAELSTHYQLLDQMQVYLENEVLFSYQSSGNKGGRNDIPWIYPSYAYFSKAYYARHPGYPYYLYKVNQAPATDMFYGWNEQVGDVKREHAADIVLSDINETETPKAPFMTGITVSGASVKISFSDDSQSDVTGYKVYISKGSRGWDYGSFKGDLAAKAYWANPGGWKPAMYDHLFQMPPGDVAVLDTQQPEISIDNLPKGVYYLSIMAVDRYGQEVGKAYYPPSNEIRVEIR